MAHAHTCSDCAAVLETGDFDCELDQDHAYALCDRCAATREEPDEAVDIGGEG